MKLYLLELRAPFLVASLLPVGLGAAVALFHTGVFDWSHFAVTLLGVAALHAGANIANDYFDHKSGCDKANTDYVRPFTGGSRMIQQNLLSPRQVLIESIVLYALGLGCGIYLTITVGWWVLVLGVTGAACGFFYTAPPLRLCARGIGEIIVGLNFGTLVTLGSYYVQTGSLAWAPVIASVPVAALICAVLYINQFQDARADEKVRKRHWVVRLGKKRAAALFPVIMCLPYAAIVISVTARAMPAWSLLALLTLPLALKAVLVTVKFHSAPKRLVPANALTVLTHSAFALLLGAGYLLST